jgi:putative membrane protein
MTTPGPDAGGPARGDPAGRRPNAVYGVGDEPDPRFSMANERTALAWVRTSLAFVAGGVGLTSVARLADLPRLVDVVSAVMCVLGGWLAVSALLGWRRKEMALRTGRPLPAPVALPWLAGAVVVAAAVLGVLVLVRV